MKQIVALSWGDLRNLTRDPMLIGAIVGPLILAMVLRFGLPLAEELVWEQWAVDLSVHQPFVMSLMLQMVPLMIGMLAGFIILDERDEGILHVLAVTPLSTQGYMFYRLGSPVLLNVLLSFVVLLLSGMTSFSLWTMVPMVLLLGLEAPIIALFLAVFSSNKVEGLALSKVTSVLLVAPIISYFLQSSWQMVAGVLPSYWVMKAFLAGDAGLLGEYWLYAGVGAVYHGVLLLVLIRKFQKRV